MTVPANYVSAADLVNRIRRGDCAGIEELYCALSGAALPKLLRTVDSQMVEDKFHDVVVTVLAAIQSGSLRDPARLMGFAQTVTRRSVSEHIRGNITRRRRLVPMGALEFPTGAESPEKASIESERLAVARAALRSLCTRDRELLTRFYLNDESPDAICRIMELTPTQYRLYKSRAVARCSKYVLAHGVPPQLNFV